EESALHSKTLRILGMLKLENVAERRVSDLPFGTRKRIELGRALAAEPKLLLLDEPASGLNHEEVGELGALIRELRERLRLTILLGGESIARLRTEDIVRRGVAHVPDGRGTFAQLTTEENLRLGAYTRRDRTAVEADLERIYGYFPRLRERREQQAGTLSGGEQQMLAISRALMLSPKLMLLDEPSFGLAPLLVRELFDILRRINEREQVSMLLVEQNAAMALDLADRAYLIETGRVVLSGTA